MPDVTGAEAYWGLKQKAIQQHRLMDLPEYKPIEMPRHSPTGFIAAFFSVVTGFAADLAHLVDGDRRPDWGFRSDSRLRWRNRYEYELPRQNSRGSITSGARLGSRSWKAA